MNRAALLAAALSLVVAVPAAAVAHGPGNGSGSPQAEAKAKAERAKAKAKAAKAARANRIKAARRAALRTTTFVVNVCVTADATRVPAPQQARGNRPATSTTVQTAVLWGNAPALRLFTRDAAFTAKLDRTKVRVAGPNSKWTLSNAGDWSGKRGTTRGTFADLKAGDLVTLVFRAPRATADPAALPAATWAIDQGANPNWCPVATPAPAA